MNKPRPPRIRISLLLVGLALLALPVRMSANAIVDPVMTDANYLRVLVSVSGFNVYDSWETPCYRGWTWSGFFFMGAHDPYEISFEVRLTSPNGLDDLTGRSTLDDWDLVNLPTGTDFAMQRGDWAGYGRYGPSGPPVPAPRATWLLDGEGNGTVMVEAWNAVHVPDTGTTLALLACALAGLAFVRRRFV